MTSTDGTDDAARTILEQLLIAYPAQFSVNELALVVGDPVATQDGLADLVAAGLVHERDDCYWPTRAAHRFGQLSDTP